MVVLRKIRRRNTKHLTSEELVDYLGGSFAQMEDRLQAIEYHLAECDGCLWKARAVRRWLRGVEGWTSRAHGEALIRAMGVRALQRLELPMQRRK
jgi:hypothetical protein